jgi:hypothetical protein
MTEDGRERNKCSQRRDWSLSKTKAMRLPTAFQAAVSLNKTC